MQRATVAEPVGTLPDVTYVLQVKAMPPAITQGAVGSPTDPATADPADVSQEQLDGHEWAGDVYEEGDESDPADAYAALKSPDGTQAWLDRSTDGTLTGWVRDVDGTVYRYSDPDAWALDVDGAGMQPALTSDTQTEDAEGANPNEQEPPVDDPNADPALDAEDQQDGGADEATEDANGQPLDPTQDPTQDPAAAADPAADPEDAVDGGADEATEDANGQPVEEDLFTKFKKKGGQGKAYAVVVTPR